IDFGDPEPGGVAEAGGELTEQMLSAGVAVRLEGDEQPARRKRPQRAQGGPNFLRMMAVIVENTEARVPKDFLLPAQCTLERRKGARDFSRCEAQLVQQSNDGGRIGGVFLAQERGGKLPEQLAAVPNLEVRPSEMDAAVLK